MKKVLWAMLFVPVMLILPPQHASASGFAQESIQNTTIKERTVSIPVVDREIETHLQQIWQKFRNSIINKDFETALKQLVPGVQKRYRAIFNDPSNDMAARFRKINRLQVTITTERTAQAVAAMKEKEGEFGYPVNFIKDVYGEWKILGF